MFIIVLLIVCSQVTQPIVADAEEDEVDIEKEGEETEEGGEEEGEEEEEEKEEEKEKVGKKRKIRSDRNKKRMKIGKIWMKGKVRMVKLNTKEVPLKEENVSVVNYYC